MKKNRLFRKSCRDFIKFTHYKPLMIKYQRHFRFAIKAEMYKDEKTRGRFLIVAAEFGNITDVQMEVFNKYLRRYLKKTAHYTSCTYHVFPYTSKPAEVRMGKGKGKIEGYLHPVVAGQALFQLRNISDELADKIFITVSKKSPIKIAKRYLDF